MTSYEPIVISGRELHTFAENAERFCATLSPEERQMWQSIVAHAGAPSETLDAASMARAFAGLWEDGTQIAPLYSGDMPDTGHTD